MTRYRIGRTTVHREAVGEAATSRRRLLRLSAGGAALAGIAWGVGREPEQAQAAAMPGIVGAWIVKIPLGSGMPNPAYDTFYAVGTFMADGNFIAQFDSADANTGAAIGCGVWQQTGDGAFSATFASVEYDATTGAPMDIAKVYQDITLDPSGNTWKARLRIAVFGLDGVMKDMSPIFDISATRIGLEPFPA